MGLCIYSNLLCDQGAEWVVRTVWRLKNDLGRKVPNTARNRLKTRQKASDTRRKIIVGAIVTTEALKDPKIARWMAATLRKNATREVDQKEIAGLLAELDAKAGTA